MHAHGTMHQMLAALLTSAALLAALVSTPIAPALGAVETDGAPVAPAFQSEPLGGIPTDPALPSGLPEASPSWPPETPCDTDGGGESEPVMTHGTIHGHQTYEGEGYATDVTIDIEADLWWSLGIYHVWPNSLYLTSGTYSLSGSGHDENTSGSGTADGVLVPDEVDTGLVSEDGDVWFDLDDQRCGEARGMVVFIVAGFRMPATWNDGTPGDPGFSVVISPRTEPSCDLVLGEPAPGVLVGTCTADGAEWTGSFGP